MEPSSQLLPGRSVEIARAVRRVVAPNAGLMTGPGTNTYLVGEAEIAVIDPGPADAEHLRAILAAAHGLIRWILVTHTHGDHSPLAQILARETGAESIGVNAPDDGRQDTTFVPQRVPRDGEMLELGAVRLRAVATPGHASNCVCYLMESERLLFTGDHVLEGVTPVILPPDGNMAAYLQSIEKLMPMPFDRIAPGHGSVIANAKKWLEILRIHRINREKKVIAALRADAPVSIEDLTVRVYDDVPADRHMWARLTLEAHLIKLQADGRAVEACGGWQLRSLSDA